MVNGRMHHPLSKGPWYPGTRVISSPADLFSMGIPLLQLTRSLGSRTFLVLEGGSHWEDVQQL